MVELGLSYDSVGSLGVNIASRILKEHKGKNEMLRK